MWLKGIRVIDLTRLISGPLATRILADFGSEVIKVQSRKISTGMEDPSHPLFYYLNRNKKGITLNLQHFKGRELFLKLVEKSDLVFENFSPRVMENLGLNYEVLRSRNPRIIMVSMSSMGKKGPWSQFVCFSHTFHALSGLTYLTSRGLDFPVVIGFAYADVVFGLYAAILALSALIYRDRSGKGCFIDLSGYEATVTLLGAEIIKKSGLERCDSYAEKFPLDLVFSVGQNRELCVLSLECSRDLQVLAKLLKCPETSEGEKLREKLKALAEQMGLTGVERILVRRRLKMSPIRSVKELVSDEKLRRRGFFKRKGKRILIGSPLRNLLRNNPVWRKAPGFGQDNEYVYGKLLGLSEEELEKYIREGIIY